MLLQFFLSESTVYVLAQVVVHFLWQGTLLGFSAACLLHVSPIRTARARYAFYCGLLALLAICPLVTWCISDTQPVATVESPEASANEAAAGAGAASAKADEGTPESITVRSNIGQSITQSISRPPSFPQHIIRLWLARQRGWIVTAWLAGICLMATRLVLGIIGVGTLARRRKPVQPGTAHIVEQVSRRMAFHVRPSVYVVERMSQAMAVGIFKPVVLLPASWISELPNDMLEAVIAHELAHLGRWDLPINFAQRVVETLLFFHPAVWWCSRRLRIEREMCCDELAQAAIGNRVVYAKALAILAHQQCSSVEALLAAGIGGAKMVLLERIRNVLGMMPAEHGRLYGPSCALVGAVAVSLVWIAVFGLGAQRQSRTSIADEVGTMSEPERTASSEAAKTTPPTKAIEQDTLADEPPQASQPLTLENLKFANYWDLRVEEAIKISKANSKALRSMGGRQVSRVSDDGSPTLSLVQTSDESSLAELEMAVRNLISNAQNAYWELSFAYRNLSTSNTALRSAQRTWKRVHLRYVEGAKGGEAKEEAQAREQYFQFKSTTNTLLNELFRAENRLRYVMGISPTDARLIRPIDKPTADRVSFDWIEITEEAISRSPELRRRKWRVKQNEMQVIAAKNLLQSRLQLSGTYRWLGLRDTFQKTARPQSDPANPPTGSADLQSLTSGQLQEWALDGQANMPLEFRKGMAQLRFHELNLAKERKKLQYEQLEVTRQIADAVRQLELNYQLSQTNFNRTMAADRQVEAVQAAFEAETVTIDQLLEAQRRQADAQTSFYRTILDYQRAIIAVHYRKGSLL